LARHPIQDTSQIPKLLHEGRVMLRGEMFGDALALARLMKVNVFPTFAGNIYGAGMHYRVVSKQYFNQRLKMSWLQKSALQLPIVSRPVATETIDFASRSTDLLVRNGQRANDSPSNRRNKSPSLIDKMMHCYPPAAKQ
jgi:hypothetical protein